MKNITYYPLQTTYSVTNPDFGPPPEPFITKVMDISSKILNT